MKNGLDNWLKDARLKSVRDPTDLEKLPPPNANPGNHSGMKSANGESNSNPPRPR